MDQDSPRQELYRFLPPGLNENRSRSFRSTLRWAPKSRNGADYSRAVTTRPANRLARRSEAALHKDALYHAADDEPPPTRTDLLFTAAKRPQKAAHSAQALLEGAFGDNPQSVLGKGLDGTAEERKADPPTGLALVVDGTARVVAGQGENDGRFSLPKGGSGPQGPLFISVQTLPWRFPRNLARVDLWALQRGQHSPGRSSDSQKERFRGGCALRQIFLRYEIGRVAPGPGPPGEFFFVFCVAGLEGPHEGAKEWEFGPGRSGSRLPGFVAPPKSLKSAQKCAKGRRALREGPYLIGSVLGHSTHLHATAVDGGEEGRG